MKYIFSPFRLIYKVYVALIFLITGILLYPFMLIFIKGENKYKNALNLKKIWAKSICILAFIRVKVNFEENFPKKQPYIVCANHASYFDILVMFLVVPNDFTFLGKAEVLKWPIVNVFFKREIDIPVYRGSVKRAKECLDLAGEALKQGRCVAIFPEGGMDMNNHKLRRFKNGAFRLSIENDVPIVPVTFVNNWKLFSDHLDLLGAGSPGIAKIKVHPTIYPTSYKDLLSLQDKTHQVIKSALDEYENRR